VTAFDANLDVAAVFDSLAQLYRRACLRWADGTKRRPEPHAARIAEMIDLLTAGTKWSDWEVLRGSADVAKGRWGHGRCRERAVVGVECPRRPFRDMAGVANAPFAASGHCRGRFAPAREAGRTVATVPHDQPRKTSNSDH